VLALTGCETAQELDKRAEAYYKPQVGQTTLRFAPYSVFGQEFAFGSTRCEIASNSAPDSSRAKVVTLARWDTDVLGGLRHSLYNHPECVPQIVLWPAEEGVIGDLETKTQGHGCGTWADAWKTGASQAVATPWRRVRAACQFPQGNCGPRPRGDLMRRRHFSHGESRRPASPQAEVPTGTLC